MPCRLSSGALGYTTAELAWETQLSGQMGPREGWLRGRGLWEQRACRCFSGHFEAGVVTSQPTLVLQLGFQSGLDPELCPPGQDLPPVALAESLRPLAPKRGRATPWPGADLPGSSPSSTDRLAL